MNSDDGAPDEGACWLATVGAIRPGISIWSACTRRQLCVPSLFKMHCMTFFLAAVLSSPQVDIPVGREGGRQMAPEGESSEFLHVVVFSCWGTEGCLRIVCAKSCPKTILVKFGGRPRILGT